MNPAVSLDTFWPQSPRSNGTAIADALALAIFVGAIRELPLRFLEKG